MFNQFLTNTPLFLTGVFLFGLMIGSFLNVVILRVPRRLDHEWRNQCHELLEMDQLQSDGKGPPGIVWERSECPKCGHAIRAHENIPVISWLFLRGKCAGCGQAISLRYPVVELSTAALFLVCAWHFGPGIQGMAAIVLTGFLVALTGIDIDHQLLPDNLTMPLLWLGLAFSLVETFTNPVDAIIGAMAGYLFLWSIYHAFRLLTGKEGMGFGDFKLMAALGAWLGWQALPLMVLLSSLVGALVGILLMALGQQQKDQPIPFGPFIAAAGWIYLIWGESIVARYMQFSGLG